MYGKDYWDIGVRRGEWKNVWVCVCVRARACVHVCVFQYIYWARESDRERGRVKRRYKHISERLRIQRLFIKNMFNIQMLLRHKYYIMIKFLLYHFNLKFYKIFIARDILRSFVVIYFIKPFTFLCNVGKHLISYFGL